MIDLCDEILGESELREHRFDWLRGDPGRNGRKAATLPVDAYYPRHGFVVEYWERQHDQAVAFFDKPDRPTASGVCAASSAPSTTGAALRSSPDAGCAC